MNNIDNDYIERRLSKDRRAFQERRSGFERRVTARELGANLHAGNERRKSDRREEDRRQHCMHCGMPYKAGPGSAKICICRVTALRGAKDLI